MLHSNGTYVSLNHAKKPLMLWSESLSVKRSSSLNQGSAAADLICYSTSKQNKRINFAAHVFGGRLNDLHAKVDNSFYRAVLISTFPFLIQLHFSFFLFFFKLFYIYIFRAAPFYMSTFPARLV